jgi:hypothetical protein
LQKEPNSKTFRSLVMTKEKMPKKKNKPWDEGRGGKQLPEAWW